MPRTKNDSFFKRSLEKLAIAKTFFKQYLPDPIQPLVDFDSLARIDRTNTDVKLRERHRDIIYQLTIDQCYTLLACAEHQGKPDFMMLVRVLRYYMDAVEAYVQQYQKWPLIVNIIFSQADTWPYPSAAEDYYELPALGSQELFGRYHLVEIQKISDAAVLNHGICAPMELLIKHSESGNFELKTSAYRPVFQACVQEVGDDSIETMLAYAASLRRKEVGKHMFDFIK